MRTILAASAAMLIVAMPAHAQLLGGGGLTGGLSGALGGTVGGTFDGVPLRSTMDSLDGAASATARGSGSASTHKSIDRKSGKVHADGSADGSLTGAAISNIAAASGPLNTMTATGNSGTASGHGSASADGQLVGTDALRSTAGSAHAATVGAADAALAGGRTASGAVTNSANGAGRAAGAGAGGASAGNFALAGSLASSADGAFAVSKGMTVLGPDATRLGTVRQVVSDTRGNVQALVVKVRGATATLPASNFTANGNALVSAMGAGQIKHAETTEPTPANATAPARSARGHEPDQPAK